MEHCLSTSCVGWIVLFPSISNNGLVCLKSARTEASFNCRLHLVICLYVLASRKLLIYVNKNRTCVSVIHWNNTRRCQLDHRRTRKSTLSEISHMPALLSYRQIIRRFSSFSVILETISSSTFHTNSLHLSVKCYFRSRANLHFHLK